MIISAPRLRLRCWAEAHRDAFAAMHADPVVMRDYGGPITRSESDAKLDRWYDTEHVPALARVPGVLSARRFRTAGGNPTHSIISPPPGWSTAPNGSRQAARRRCPSTSGRRSATACASYVGATAARAERGPYPAANTRSLYSGAPVHEGRSAVTAGTPSRRSAACQLPAISAQTLAFLEACASAARRPAVAATLDQHIKDLALVIDGTPEVHPLAGDPNNHLVQVPSIALA
jgi:hypothetical protein